MTTRIALATLLLAAMPAAFAQHQHEHAGHDHAAHAAQDPAAHQAHAAAALAQAVADSRRAPANVARDAWRHPQQTLEFFAVAPHHTVLEVTPGGGWYTEILAPLLADHGQYIAAMVDPASVAEGRGRDYQQRSLDGFKAKVAGDAERFGKVEVVTYNPAAPVLGDANSADVVLTFRNVHNWRGSGQAEGYFKAFFEVLKPGGVLGVVEHRAKADVPADDRSGYVGQDQVIAMATAAGFELAQASEINANPADTRDHPNGVWTLPPTNRHEPADADKYKAIGESDRMTLKFVKPAA
jgi:predicted methyltransferase